MRYTDAVLKPRRMSRLSPIQMVRSARDDVVHLLSHYRDCEVIDKT